MFAGAIFAECMAACLIWAMWHRVDQWKTSEGHFSEISDWILGGVAVSLIGIIFACFGTGLKRSAAIVAGSILLFIWMCFGAGV